MSIEHGNLITEGTVKLIAEKGAFLSTQTGVYLGEAPPDWSEDQKARQQAAKDGLATMFKLAKKHNAKIALGTDLVGSRELKRSPALRANEPFALVYACGNSEAGHSQ